MGKKLSAIATECASRWIKANERRARKGRTAIAVSFENMRDFAGGIADGADAIQLDLIADLAEEKVLEYERRTS